MELNRDKSKVLSIGNCKINFDYTLQGRPIEKAKFMKDIVNCSVKPAIY